jgi:hypothetical protein
MISIRDICVERLTKPFYYIPKKIPVIEQTIIRSVAKMRKFYEKQLAEGAEE